MTSSLVVCPKPSLTPGSRPYSSVTVTGSCIRVASSVARHILVSSSITCSLTSRNSPLEPTEEILGRGENSREGIHFFLLGAAWEISKARSERSGPPRLQPSQALLYPPPSPGWALPPSSSDTSLRCKLKSPSLKLVTDTPAKLFSGMTVLA